MRKVLHPMDKAVADEHDSLARGRLVGMNPGYRAQGDDQCQLHLECLNYAFKPHSLPFAPDKASTPGVQKNVNHAAGMDTGLLPRIA